MQGGYDAIVLAAAGLIRLGLGDRIRARFDTAQMLPAAGQGALGIEIRADATGLGERLAALTHRPTGLAVAAERAVSRALGGSCSVPIAAHATWRDARLELRAAVGDPERLDQPLLRAEGAGVAIDDAAAAEALGARVAQALLEQGAAAYLAPAAPAEPSPAGP
jgi:hydroxymethylbilane synthase